MGLQITNQTNEQECGVCAITSLHNYYYSQKLEKEQVLDQSHINSTGMTIFDFESLAQIVGLECESYEINWSEFVKLKIKNYFVALVATKDGQANHYVIVKKHRRSFIIFDSCSLEPKEISSEQFKNIFLNVIILINKKPNKLFSKVFSNTKTLLMFDLKFVLLNILLSTLILGTSILGASFLNWIIDMSISKSSINNLISISFVFVVVYFGNDLLTYISNLYVSNHLKTYYMLFTNKILSAVEYKKSDFLYKVDRNWIYKVDECVYNISNFCILEVNKLITNIIFSIICICIIGSIDWYMLIFVVIFALIELIPFLFAYRKKKDLFIGIVRTENKNAEYYKQLIKNLSFETWQAHRTNLIANIKQNYSKIYKNFNDVALFKSNKDLFKSLVKSIAEIALIAFASYLIIKLNHFTIGKLTFIIAAFNLYKTSVSNIFDYFLAKIEFEVYWQVYKDLTNVGNLKDDKISLDEIKNITFVANGDTYKIESNKKFNETNVSIHKLLEECNSLKFNNKVVNKDSKSLMDQIIIVDQHTSIDLDLFFSLLNKNPSLYSNYLRKFNIDVNNNTISFYDKIIVNLLCLLECKDKIIIIDSLLHYVKSSDKDKTTEIINKIRSNNSLFIIGKETND